MSVEEYAARHPYPGCFTCGPDQVAEPDGVVAGVVVQFQGVSFCGVCVPDVVGGPNRLPEGADQSYSARSGTFTGFRTYQFLRQSAPDLLVAFPPAQRAAWPRHHPPWSPERRGPQLLSTGNSTCSANEG